MTSSLETYKHLQPFFLSIHLVHRRQPTPPLNQRNRLHRIIRHILASLAQRPIRHRAGDGKYIIPTSLAWRKKSFGSDVSFAWAPHILFWRVKSNFICTRILGNDLERFGKSVDGTFAWWDIAWRQRYWLCDVLGLGPGVWKNDVEAKNVGFL